MNNRPKRDTERINYAILHNTGARIPLRESSTSSDEALFQDSQTNISEESDGSQERTIVEDTKTIDAISEDLSQLSLTGVSVKNRNMDNTEKDKLVSLQEAVHDDITDFIDENPTNELLVIDDVDLCIRKLEELRSNYRRIHKDIRALDPADYDGNLKNDFDKVMFHIKEHLSNVKIVKKSIRNEEVNAAANEKFEKEQTREAEFRNRTIRCDFLLVDIEMLMKSVLSDVDKRRIQSDRDIVSDDELLAMRTNMPSIQKRIDNLSNKYKVNIPSLTGDCFMQSPFWKFFGDEKKSRINDLLKLVDACSDLGIRIIVIPLVDGGSIENKDQLKSLLDVLNEIEHKLKDLDLRILFESDLNPKDLKKFIDQFNPEVFGINYDIGNSASLGYNHQEELLSYGKNIYNIHIKDRVLNGETVPLGEGDADFSLFYKSLKEVNYSGNFILQTARSINGEHAKVLIKYKKMTELCLKEYGL